MNTLSSTGAVHIETHTGPREALRALFELAEDSPSQLDAYLHRGRLLVARTGDGEIIGHLQLVETGEVGRIELKSMAVAENLQGRGIGRALVTAALERDGPRSVVVATAAADIGNLRFYQRLGFRLRSIERDAFTPATGYAPDVRIDGIELRDRVWLDLSPSSGEHRETMNDHRSPLFCDSALAERLERVESQLVADASRAAHLRQEHPAGFVIPVAGGVASFAEDGSPYNKVAGLGFGGLPGGAEFDAIEEAFAARGAPVQVELAHLADPAFLEFLTGRGYRIEAFENVLGLALTGEHEPAGFPGIEVRPSGDDEFERWLDVVTDGSMHPDTQGVPWREDFPRELYMRAERDSRAAGVTRYAALRDGVMAGGAGIRMAEGVAQFAGAATAPAHRRRGIQSALLSARLADAAAAGCDVAVITTQPGSKSQQNAQRRGFDLLYTRAVLVKQP